MVFNLTIVSNSWLPRKGLSLFSMFYLAGCSMLPGLHISVDEASGHNVADPYQVVQVTPELIGPLRRLQAQEANPAEQLSQIAAGEYVVGPADILQIIVWDHPELTNPFGAVTPDTTKSGQLVAADGTVYFPYVGVFKAAGLTVQQVRSHISNQLAAVINKPQVDVRVASFRSARVQVTGEVQSPGLVTLDDTGKGFLDAINERGGLNLTASRRTALLIRDGRSEEIDIAALLSGSRPSLNPKLKMGDIVHVPDANNDQVFVLGEVAKQGPLIMGQQALTLTEALTKSGGLDKLSSNDAGILVFRKPTQENQRPTIFALNMSRAEGLLLAGEFALEPRDVVYVKATKFAQYNQIINQLLPTISTIFQVDALVNR
ncbi:MAG: sugar transporter [Nevskiaceae bacterium]|nr:MAG: sugar transporter [Nevskiaceae bacterium]